MGMEWKMEGDYRWAEPIWEWTMSGLTVTIYSDAPEVVPNWFHRLMQKIILGIKWNKLEKGHQNYGVKI